MVFLNSKNMDLIIDVEKGFVKSLQYNGKEYIGATVPLFLIALRDHEGKQTRVNTFDMALKNYTQTNEEIVATYDNGSFDVMISVKMSSQISWRIEITGVEGYAVEWVSTPFVKNFLINTVFLTH